MVFSSFVFLLIFLPFTLIGHAICPRRFQNWFLFLTSLIFYAWGEPVYALVLLGSITINYALGLFIARSSEKPALAKALFVFDLALNLAILFVFKYTDFLLESVNAWFGLNLPLPHIPLPIGVSFFTFQIISYIVDVYRGVVMAQQNFIIFGAYVAMFPQLIAGPIVQYKTVADELGVRHVSIEDFADGIWRFAIGLSKKVILANSAGALFDEISGWLPGLSTAGAWLGAVAFTFQIYFDFSGYSDMAIGLGRMFGFHFLENFDHPYISSSVTEFWRRWHISLGTWFREYVYIPLGGNRRGLPRQLFNILVVWMLTGLWHGASWNFVLWGLYYALLLIVEKLFLLRWLNRLPRVVGVACTFVIVVIGWTIFALTDFAALGTYLKAMAGIGAPLFVPSVFFYAKTRFVLLIFCVICSLPLRLPRKWMAMRPFIVVTLMVISLAFLVADSYNPFLYFRF